MTLLLDDDDVRAACDIEAMVKGIESALVAESAGSSLIMPPRQNLTYDDVFLRVMPVIMGSSGMLGLKMFQGSIARGVSYVVVLCDLLSAELLAVLDGHYLTAARTGATSGVATRHLARPDATSVGVIGSGLEAETNLQAICTVRDITSVSVFSPRRARREAFAERMSPELGIAIQPAATPQQVVAGADIVIVATNTGPAATIAYQGAWLEPGQHVVSIGSTTTALREIDPETFRRADTIVFDVEPDTLLEESGDYIAMSCSGGPGNGRVLTLSQLLLGDDTAATASTTTLFKSVGAAIQDIAAAMTIYEHARQQGLGRHVPNITSLKTFT
jgi:ornithine cyclodeaminase/alanine dehydrogenase-like protein (mu-crystallin family)